MHRERDLAGIFTVLLFGVVWPAGCHRYDYGVCSTIHKRLVDDPAALAEAMKDNKLSDSECTALCTNSRPYEPPPPPPEPTSSTTADACMNDSTTGTGSGTSTSTATTSGTSTTSDPGTSTSADTTADTGTSTSTTADTGTSTGADPCLPTSTSSSTDYEYDYDPSILHTCRPNTGSLYTLFCYYRTCTYGRRPAGLRSEGRALASRPLGRLFAEGAHLEAASVPAFERLAAALLAHDAPASLRERALSAANDERRHATQMTALAAEFGGTPATPEIDATPVPTLLEMARDNAIQGCVGETWAALLARHQADTAEFPQVRDLMTEIAADETEHAELAWAIDAWLHTKLSPAEQTEVLAARTEACDSLQRSLAAATDHPAQQAAGLPRRATALTLHEGLRRALWALPA